MKSILHTRYAIFIIFLLIGMLVYFPMFFNGFVWDDIDFVVNNVQIHSFNFTIFIDNVFNSGHYYRQVTPIYYSLLYNLFGVNAFPYHFIQLLLHITCVNLIYLLFRHYMNNKIAFVLSLFFLIHPINTEAVVWISSVQTQFYTLFGLTALLLIHNYNKMLTQNRISVIGIFLFLCLMTYEAGILYFLLVLLYYYLFQKKYLKIMSLTFVGILILYIFLRLIGNALIIGRLIDNPIEKNDLIHTLFTIPSIILYYFKTLVYPQDLSIWQYWSIKVFHWANVLLPAIIIQITLITSIGYITSRPAKQRQALLFFSSWTCIGLVTLIQLFPLDMTVSDRWFYFPFIGLLGIVGCILQFTLNNPKYINSIVILLLVVLIPYAIRTQYRTYDWKDNFTLYSHDLKLDPENVHLNFNVGGAYILQEKYKEAIPYIEKVRHYAPMYKYTLQELGTLYEKTGNTEKALYYYKEALRNNRFKQDKEADIYYSIAYNLMKLQKYDEVIALLTNDVINTSYIYADLLYLRAQAYYYRKDYYPAFNDIDILYSRNYELDVEELYLKLKKIIEEHNY